MNERQRADELARAIDELIHGATPKPRPAQADDNELRSLIQVARSRLAVSRTTEVAATQASVWERLMSRLETRPAARREVTQDVVADEAMRQTIAARRQMSDAILDLAEQHREEVWQRLQERIRPGKRKKPPTRGGPGFTPEDRPLRARFFPTGDDELDSLLSSEINRRTLRDVAARETNAATRRLHDRMRNDPGKNPPINLSEHSRGHNWTGFGFVGGVVLLVAAALGPLPATGLAHHPAVEAVRYADQHMGVQEQATVPPPASPTVRVEPVVASPQEASEQLGLAVSAPTTMLGIPVSSSLYYASGVTSPSAGVFVLTYEGVGISVTVYQEAAGGAELAIAPGAAVDVNVDDAPATYFEGGWSTDASGSPVWQNDGTGTLVFERNGLRTTIVYKGPRVYADALITAAATLH